LETLFEILAPEDGIENQSLLNGLPMFGDSYYMLSTYLQARLSNRPE